MKRTKKYIREIIIEKSSLEMRCRAPFQQRTTLKHISPLPRMCKFKYLASCYELSRTKHTLNLVIRYKRE